MNLEELGSLIRARAVAVSEAEGRTVLLGLAGERQVAALQELAAARGAWLAARDALFGCQLVVELRPLQRAATRALLEYDRASRAEKDAGFNVLQCALVNVRAIESDIEAWLREASFD